MTELLNAEFSGLLSITNISITTISILLTFILSSVYKHVAGITKSDVPTFKFFRYLILSLLVISITVLIIEHNILESKEPMLWMILYPIILTVACFPDYKVMQIGFIGGLILASLHSIFDYKSPIHMSILMAYTLYTLKTYGFSVSFWRIRKDKDGP